jgi:hypothetical protein
MCDRVASGAKCSVLASPILPLLLILGDAPLGMAAWTGAAWHLQSSVLAFRRDLL